MLSVCGERSVWGALLWGWGEGGLRAHPQSPLMHADS